MSLIVIKAGISDSIQDMGRYGYQHLGINPCGAMDKYSLQIANLLVGNEPGEAAIELHFPASVFLFTVPALIALSGADFSASINGKSVLAHAPVFVEKNDILQFHKQVSGTWAYIALAGGFAIEKWLNSKSTHLKAEAGGYNGRKLIKNDEILLNPGVDYFGLVNRKKNSVLSWQANISWNDESRELFVLPGNEWQGLTDESKQSFLSKTFIIAPQSDRMGYCLNNIELCSNYTNELVSSAVNFGTIQMLPDGKLIILMADHQTTGGYPRIAHVITAHHSKLAQLKPGDEIKFRLTNLQSAEELLIKQHQHLLQLKNACTFKLEQYLYDNRF
jgi:antagonist of KipI